MPIDKRHPGEYVADALDKIDLTGEDLANIIEYDTEKIHDILDKEESIDAEFSMLFARFIEAIENYTDDQLFSDNIYEMLTEEMFLLKSWHEYHIEVLKNDDQFKEELEEVKKRREELVNANE